jgi:hypothetical protein
MADYIFAYGSLMESNSRKRTTPFITNIWPARIKGFLRGWFARVPTHSISTTFLGCIRATKFEPESRVNGILFRVNNYEINLLDYRENGYLRVQIPTYQIDDFTGVLTKDDKVWIYLNQFEGEYDQKLQKSLPNFEFPIVQSYVDMCINGCIETEELFKEAKESNFIEEFIQETKFWSKFWVNDRIYPRRAFIYCPNADLIDNKLKNFLPNSTIFNQIKIEGWNI